MTKLNKLLQGILESKKVARFQELSRVLVGLGYVERPGKGSHAVFSHSQYRTIIIPRHSPVKRCYVEQVRLILEEYFQQGGKLK